jgi:UPF0716 protein FxsA
MTHPLKIAAVLALLAFPILEIGLLIRAGQWLGFWRLALIVIATAVLGTAVIRRTGLSVLTKARAEMDAGGHVFGPLFDGLVQLTAGILLIFPGLVSDALGLLLLIPWVRQLVVGRVLPKLFTVTTLKREQPRRPFRQPPGDAGAANTASGFDGDAGGVTIEGEYERIRDDAVEPDRALKPRNVRRSAN